jgi:hypothetical protein
MKMNRTSIKSTCKVDRKSAAAVKPDSQAMLSESDLDKVGGFGSAGGGVVDQR